MLNRRLEVMDSTAISLCMENKLPILVLNLWDPEALEKALRGEKVGTLVAERAPPDRNAKSHSHLLTGSLPGRYSRPACVFRLASEASTASGIFSSFRVSLSQRLTISGRST